MINIGNGAVQVYLSSNAVPDPKSDDTILIGPPFFLELKLGGFKLPIQVGARLCGRSSVRGFWIGCLTLPFTRLNVLHACLACLLLSPAWH